MEISRGEFLKASIGLIGVEIGVIVCGGKLPSSLSPEALDSDQNLPPESTLMPTESTQKIITTKEATLITESGPVFEEHYDDVPLLSDFIATKEAPLITESEPVFEKYYDDVPTLSDFIATVSGGSGNKIAGVWSEGIFAFKVIHSNGNSAPNEKNTASTYYKGKELGVDVLLIHNYLGGSRLYSMDKRPIFVIYPNGSTQVAYLTNGNWHERYQGNKRKLKKKYRLQGCEDCSWHTSREILNIHYTGGAGLVFQTSINTLDYNGILILEFNFKW